MHNFIRVLAVFITLYNLCENCKWWWWTLCWWI